MKRLFMSIPPDNHTDEKISKLTDVVGELAKTVSTQIVRHDNLSNDHKLLDQRVDKNEIKLEELQKVNTGIVTVSKILQLVGVAIVGAIFTLWNTQSAKIDATTAKTEINSQNIDQLRKDTDDLQHQVDDNKAKIMSNREAILSAVKDAKKDGDLK